MSTSFAEDHAEVELIRSARFRKEREGEWKRLSDLVLRVEKKGLSGLTFDESLELTGLYRQSVNSLSLAREISLDQALLHYLESLTTRAYLAVYAPRATLVGLVGRFFRTGAPQAIRRSWLHILVAALLLFGGAFAAYFLTIADPTWYYAFVPGGLSGGRGPEASEAFLREALYGQNSSSAERLAAFSTQLFTHNTQVSIMSFTLGVIGCLPSGFLTFYNGTILGTFFAVHQAKGLGFDLFGWLSIHGVTELAALIIAAAGGFRLGAAVLFPGQRTRGAALRHAGRDATKLALVAALMLLAAGVLEGFGRQLITDLWSRIIIGWSIGGMWLAWFVLCGRSWKVKS